MSVSTLASPVRAEPRKSFARVAVFTLVYTLFVILFGAVVRVSGSGDGCGRHWPTCHGDVAHLPKTLETAIELTHRVTSGLALVAVLVLLIAAIRTYPVPVTGGGSSRKKLGAALEPAPRRLAVTAVLLMIVEGLIGASLVLAGWVGADASLARAFVMPAHLVSTFALTAVLTTLVVARAPFTLSGAARVFASAPVAVTVLGLVVVSATGAVTALGDTVFPPEARSLGGRVAEDFGREGHFLTRLRVVHPVLAVLVSGLVVVVARRLARGANERARAAARAVVAAVGIQLVAGVVNVLLSAPAWLQVVHLALALAVWMAFVVLVVERGQDGAQPF